MWKGNVILTAQDIKIEAIGSGKKIRGRRHRAWRPDLIVLDDVENDENVNTAEQRRKLESWFKKAVSKAGDTYTDSHVHRHGTPLRFPAQRSTEESEMTSEPIRPCCPLQAGDLWERWTEIYTNLFDDKHKEHAREFYEANEADMLTGTQVLWPEKMDYYKLMVDPRFRRGSGL